MKRILGNVLWVFLCMSVPAYAQSAGEVLEEAESVCRSWVEEGGQVSDVHWREPEILRGRELDGDVMVHDVFPVMLQLSGSEAVPGDVRQPGTRVCSVVPVRIVDGQLRYRLRLLSVGERRAGMTSAEVRDALQSVTEAYEADSGYIEVPLRGQWEAEGRTKAFMACNQEVSLEALIAQSSASGEAGQDWRLELRFIGRPPMAEWLEGCIGA